MGDVVEVQTLAVREREVDGPSADPPQPRVGDRGRIVTALGDDLYLMEHRTDDGRSMWTAEFHAGELVLVERGGD